MGQDHGGLEPRNHGSEGKESALCIGTKTAGKQRTIVKERERESPDGCSPESCVGLDTYTDRETKKDAVNTLC